MLNDGPLLENTTASVKLLGTEALLIPFAQQTSAQRISMSAQHLAHSLSPKRPEHPYVFTGYESIIGRYDFNSTARDQDIYIIDIIPKYQENLGALQIKVNPMYTVIYVGKEDKQVSYFHMEKYGKCTDGYGYKNEWMNTNYLQKDMMVPKEMELSRSTAHIGVNGYGMGVNANVAFMTTPEVNNDAFMISDRLAEKFTTIAVSSISGDIYIDQLPINIYGDESEHKFMPDIGEVVGPHGIICGFRNPTDATFISDALSLDTPYPQCDDLYYAPVGAEIIDIEFYAGADKNKLKNDSKLFSQVDKYLAPMNLYWSRIVKAYEDIKKKDYNISPEFNTLVTRAMAMLMSSGKRIPSVHRRPDIKLQFGKETIEFVRFKITYAYERPLTVAGKLSDRVGTKGVVSKIVPWQEMPVDEYGVVCDVVINPQAVPNRMNPSQIYETGINRVTIFVQKQAIEIYKTSGAVAAVEYVLEYIRDVNPKYEELIARKQLMYNPEATMDYIINQDELGELGIFLMIPPFLETMNPETIQFLKEKYRVKITPVKFYVTDIATGLRKQETSESNVCISSKYMVMLYNIPQAKAPGVGHINQFKIPVKPNAKSKHMSPIGETPLRMGEDEDRIITMSSGQEAVIRLMGIHANSYEAVMLTCSTSLNHPDPAKIERIPISNEEIMRTNNVVGVANHMMATMGIDMTNVQCEAFDEVKFTADLNS